MKHGLESIVMPFYIYSSPSFICVQHGATAIRYTCRRLAAGACHAVAEVGLGSRGAESMELGIEMNF